MRMSPRGRLDEVVSAHSHASTKPSLLLHVDTVGNAMANGMRYGRTKSLKLDPSVA